jgi:hypothetical protein
MNATKNPFDFADLSDLPEELQKKLHTDTTDNAKVYADVVIAGAAAGYAELEINQIMAAAVRMNIDVPTQQTVRGYLNRAVELGMIQKPSRQTYGVKSAVDSAPAEGAKAAPAKGAKAEAVVTPDATVASDPLAGL